MKPYEYTIGDDTFLNLSYLAAHATPRDISGYPTITTGRAVLHQRVWEWTLRRIDAPAERDRAVEEYVRRDQLRFEIENADDWRELKTALLKAFPALEP